MAQLKSIIRLSVAINRDEFTIPWIAVTMYLNYLLRDNRNAANSTKLFWRLKSYQVTVEIIGHPGFQYLIFRKFSICSASKTPWYRASALNKSKLFQKVKTLLQTAWTWCRILNNQPLPFLSLTVYHWTATTVRMGLASG